MAPDLIDVAKDAYGAFAQRDPDRLRALCHPEVAISVPTGALAGRSGPYRGHDGIGAYLEDLAAVWDELELRPHEFVDVGEGRVVVIGRVVTRRERTRKDLPSIWLLEIRDGLLARVDVYSDAAQATADSASRRPDAAVPET